MKTLITTLVALLACAAWTAEAADAGRDADVAALTRISNDWDQAIVRKDEKAIAGNMAEDFRLIDGYGNLETRKSFVAGIVDYSHAEDAAKDQSQADLSAEKVGIEVAPGEE